MKTPDHSSLEPAKMKKAHRSPNLGKWLLIFRSREKELERAGGSGALGQTDLGGRGSQCCPQAGSGPSRVCGGMKSVTHRGLLCLPLPQAPQLCPGAFSGQCATGESKTQAVTVPGFPCWMELQEPVLRTHLIQAPFCLALTSLGVFPGISLLPNPSLSVCCRVSRRRWCLRELLGKADANRGQLVSPWRCSVNDTTSPYRDSPYPMWGHTVPRSFPGSPRIFTAIGFPVTLLLPSPTHLSPSALAVWPQASRYTSLILHILSPMCWDLLISLGKCWHGLLGS